MGVVTKLGKAVLQTARRLRILRWVAATRLRMAWSGMKLELEFGPDVVLYELPSIRLSTRGRGGSLRIVFGRDVRIWDNLDLEVTPGVDSLLELGDNTIVYSNVALKLRGGSIKVGPFTQIREQVVIKATGDVEIGASNTISYNVVLHCTERITLGDHVGLGERTSLIDSGHDVDGSDEPWTEQPAHTKPISIGRNTMAFSNVVIMRGTTIGKNSIVAASSVVTGGDHPDGAVLLGSPARVTRTVANPRDVGTPDSPDS